MSEFESEKNASAVEEEPRVPTKATEQPVCAAILEDHAFVRDYLTDAAVQTLTREFVTVVVMRTPYSRVQLRVHYLEGYPDVLPIVEISSPTLPMLLLRNKEKECTEKAQALQGRPQLRAIYEHLHRFIHTNLFIPCWREMKQVAALCEGKGQLGCDEKEGLLVMRLRTGAYQQTIRLRVPLAYPEEGVQLEFVASNFPSDIQHMFKSQAEEIVRRCEAGFSGEQALQVSNPIKLPAKAGAAEPKQKLTAGSLKNLKHDVNVLKQMSDLRVATARSSKHTYVTQATAEKREARKELRKLARSELEADSEQQRALLEEEQQEMKELMRSKVSEVAQPSLQAVARFLVEDYACRLAVEPCQACQQTVLPADPESEPAKNPKSERRAMRTFCGHWLHYCCLNDWLSSPPFIRQCPVCDRRIWHPDWPEDHKLLEKAWQNKEARNREMNDVSDFMGMGGQFSAR